MAINQAEPPLLITHDGSLHFSCQSLQRVTDPRPGEPIYPLVNILFMSICAVIAAADDYVAIARFAKTKKEGLAEQTKPSGSEL